MARRTIELINVRSGLWLIKKNYRERETESVKMYVYEMEEEEMERREGGTVLKDSGKVGGR